MSRSIVTKYTELCFFCGKQAECQHHLTPGIGTRDLADYDGLILPSCNKHHNMGSLDEQIHGTAMTIKLSKMLGQAIWEKEWVIKQFCKPEEYEEIRWKSRAEFLKRYGKSWL